MTLRDKENALPLATIIIAMAIMLSLFLTTNFESLEFPHGDFLIFHWLLEIAIVSVSLSIFFVRWFPYRYTRDTQSLLIGVTFLAVAIFETGHALTYPGMTTTSGSTSATLSFYFLFFARLTMGLLLLIASFQSGEIPVRGARRGFYLIGTMTYVAAISLLLAGLNGSLPSLADQEEKATALVSIMSIAIIAILLLGAARYWQTSRKLRDLTYMYLAIALILAVFEELASMSNESFYDDFDLLEHLFGFCAFLFIFFALFRASVAKPYYELEKAREELEARVQQRTAELSRSNRDLEQFAYVASHDIKAPLSVISGYLQMMRDHNKEINDPLNEKYVGKALESSERMQRYLDDLLEYSRVGRSNRPFAQVDFESALTNALSSLEVSIRENGAMIKHDHLPTLMGDESLIALLFQNLVGNAIKYRSVDNPQISISVKQEGNDWIFSVKDNGKGFDQKDSARIFEIFQRLETDGKTPGTGIGLATCKRIVEYHGGRIWAGSEKGKGATFYFAIPTWKN